ncbi:MAG TPA: C25 family cysteine peptidase, partial [Chitinophagaceae bacterium]|nr:C25 family cysteine peptidase [Chitinophagaceae bacterium]
GSINDTVFYGQKGQDFPAALTTTSLSGKVTFGSVVAAECCYGNQLFEPASLEEMPICNRYLTEGALAMVGSSTTSYGPPQSLGLSDLITQYFLANVLGGASTGRAFLQAQQKFLQESAPHIDPYEVKTYTQYYLLGDPSLVLVNNPKIFSPKSKGAVEKKMAPAQRKNRRAMLEAKGVELGRSISPPRKQKGKSRSKKLNEVLKPFQMQGRGALSFQSRKSFAGPGKSLTGGVRFHVVTKRKAVPIGRAGIQPIEAVIVKEIGGNLVDVKKYEAK